LQEGPGPVAQESVSRMQPMLQLLVSTSEEATLLIDATLNDVGRVTETLQIWYEGCDDRCPDPTTSGIVELRLLRSSKFEAPHSHCRDSINEEVAALAELAQRLRYLRAAFIHAQENTELFMERTQLIQALGSSPSRLELWRAVSLKYPGLYTFESYVNVVVRSNRLGNTTDGGVTA